MKTNYKIQKITWEDYDNLIDTIVKKLKNKKIDVVCPILRGGSVIGLSIANYFKLPTVYMRIKRSLSNEPNSDFGKPKIIINLSGQYDLKDKTILLCEDTIDTELTIKTAIQLCEQYSAKKIYVATLYNFSKNKSYITGKQMNKHIWIEFPWERSENNEN